MFVSFLIGIPEVGSAPRRPSARSTTAVAPDVPQNGCFRPSNEFHPAILQVLVKLEAWRAAHCFSLRAIQRVVCGTLPIRNVAKPPTTSPRVGVARPTQIHAANAESPAMSDVQMTVDP